MDLRRVLDVFFPLECVACDAPGAALCDACLPRRALRERLGTLDLFALGAYDGALRKAVLATKDGRRDVAERLGFCLARAFAAEIPRGALFVGVPTSARRRGNRGFDQGTLLAREVALRYACDAAAALVHVAGDAQRGRARRERLRARHRFGVARPELVRGRTIYLVDDVVTTGATASDCAATLAAHGACVAGILAVARTAKTAR